MTGFFKERTPVNQARKIFLNAFNSIENTEQVSIDECSGRILSDSVTANRNVPHYRRAAMDGYAVRSSDTVGASPDNPIMLQIDDEEVVEGTCVRVHTGSSIPDGADAVVMVEDTTPVGDMVEILTHVHPNKHVGIIGEDIEKNDTVFTDGHMLRPCDLAVLASLGINNVTVYKKPHVSVIPTGNEVVPRTSSSQLQPGKVVETNGLMTAKYVEKWGGLPEHCDIVSDDPELIISAIQSQLESDIIILCGGTSVGERDHVPDVVKSLGNVLVHGVSMSPGKPIALGMIDNVPVVCLPGYPVAAFIGLFMFARPALRKIGHIPDLPDATVKAELSDKIPSKEGYMTFSRVVVDFGSSTAHPVMTSGAGVLSSVAKSNGLVIVPENIEGYEKGEKVDIFLIE
ncbi:molybdenum cofactor synthesis domain protein [Methanohalobium evestigatum Z-7303]|uniref:Molybdenum cofactor synthesis domain protein n=1 Tax=Methanohalobium evestigatum (strain ATCC BAA-1072 / DSM 3721 / NBRC 107634 / OCM 161 / Z-7303) TaxID=644295 RepID=D7E870_METEZ|nr:gephyrin-like molybdotransferase Glp [Methanohalobium evestigatum]ADI73412.1 molybdenum cofactor synthesis domain protein [Methanohalobium evestigatum Z-7303]